MITQPFLLPELAHLWVTQLPVGVVSGLLLLANLASTVAVEPVLHILYFSQLAGCWLLLCFALLLLSSSLSCLLVSESMIASY